MEGERKEIDHDAAVETTNEDTCPEPTKERNVFKRVLGAICRVVRWHGELLGTLLVVVSQYLLKVLSRILARLAFLAALICVLCAFAKFLVIPLAISLLGIQV